MQVYFFAIIAVFSLLFIVVKIYMQRIQQQTFIANAKLEALNHEYNRLLQEKCDLEKLNREEIELRFLSERKEALALQKYEMVNEQLQDWEEQKKQSLEHAKAAIFDVGYKLSNQLIAEHKRESDVQKEEAQKQYKEATQVLYKDFEKITETLSSLKEQVSISHANTDTVYKALLSPNTVGNLAEITLENILKASNLINNIDYQIQYSMIDEDNNRLRPDAIVFLPGDNILVIDSKASKFFLNLAQAKDDEEVNEIKQKLKITMRNHLKSLSNKDYRQAIANYLQHKQINHISTVMFLPTEISLEKLHNIDSQFITDAWQNNIFPAGPVGLVSILAHSKFQISEAKKTENYQSIIDEVSTLIYNISNLSIHARKLGQSLHNSLNFFDKMAASFNSNLISRAKKIEKLGVTVKSNKQIPELIDRYQVISGNRLTMIESEKNIEEL